MGKEKEPYEHEELDKIKKVQDKTQAICEFMDWISSEKGLVLAQYPENSDFLHPSFSKKEDLVAEFYDIDLKKAEKERQGVLDHIRRTQ